MHEGEDAIWFNEIFHYFWHTQNYLDIHYREREIYTTWWVDSPYTQKSGEKLNIFLTDANFSLLDTDMFLKDKSGKFTLKNIIILSPMWNGVLSKLYSMIITPKKNGANFELQAGEK